MILIEIFHRLQAASSWLYIYPQGMKEVLMYTKNKYGNPLVYITENGKNLSIPTFKNCWGDA